MIEINATHTHIHMHTNIIIKDNLLNGNIMYILNPSEYIVNDFINTINSDE